MINTKNKFIFATDSYSGRVVKSTLKWAFYSINYEWRSDLFSLCVIVCSKLPASGAKHKLVILAESHQSD